MRARLPRMLLPFAMLLALALVLVPQIAHAQGIVFVDDTVNDGLVAHFKFDEGSGTTTREWLSPSLTASLAGDAGFSGTLPPMAVPNISSLQLDAANQNSNVVTVADTASLNALTGNLTVAAWVKRSRLNGGVDTIYVNGTLPGAWHLAVMTGTVQTTVQHLAFRIGTAASTTYSTTVAASGIVGTTDWLHVAATLELGQLRLYLNGVLNRTINGVTLPSPTSGAKFVGSQSATGARLPGLIDDLRIYNRALTAAEVLRLAQGAGCPTAGTSWGSALRELQCGLAQVAPGGQVWVAAGGYRPGMNPALAFPLRKNNVAVLGGFVGSEILLSQRPAFNPAAPTTVLSGDVLGNDVALSFTNYAENARNVISATTAISFTLDGMGVSGGNAQAGAGGGALRVAAGGRATVRNLLFNSNQSAAGGGAITTASPLVVAGVTFRNNRATSGDGGALTAGAAAPVTVTLSIFLTNTAIAGGALDLDGQSSVAQSTFQGNAAVTFGGGAIKASAPLTVASSQFTRNTAAFSGGAIESSALLDVSSSLFAFNRAFTFDGGAVRANGESHFSASRFEDNRAGSAGGAISTGSPMLVETSTLVRNKVDGINCAPGCSDGRGGAIGSRAALTISASSLVSNTARLEGGAVAVTGPLVFQFSSMSENKAGLPADAGTAGRGRGGAIFAAGNMVIQSAGLDKNQAAIEGGGAVVSGTVTISTSGIDENVAGRGAGLSLAVGGTISIAGLERNVAGIDGGGIWLRGGTLTLQGATIVQNTTPQLLNNRGGGILVTGGALVVNASTVERNRSSDGGGIAVITGTLSLNGGLLVGNSANFRGGGLFVQGASITISGTQVFSNTGFTGGGAFVLTPIVVQNAQFVGNVASPGDGGGGIFAQAGATISNSLFERNHSFSGSGGALRSLAPVTITESLFASNSSDEIGGALLINGGLLTNNDFFSNTVNSNTPSSGAGGATATFFSATNVLRSSGNLWQGNSATQGGGALLANGPTTVSNDQFHGNSAGTVATSRGGAINAVAPLTVTQTIFGRNVAVAGGALAGQFFALAPVRINQSLFFGNRLVGNTSGVDMMMALAAATLTNNTFADPGSAGNSVIFSSGSMLARNSIWSGYPSGSLFNNGGAPAPTALQEFNLFFNAPPAGDPIAGGTGSLSGLDPLFVNAAATDFRLQLLSPAVDGGSDAAAAGFAVDLAGAPRFINGSALRPALVDMGALEMQRLAPTAAAGGPYNSVEGSAVALNAGASAGTAPLSFAWDCTNNGSFDVQGSAPTGQSCLYADGGAFTLRLRVSDSLGLTATVTAPVTVQNVAPVMTAPAAQFAGAGQGKPFALGAFSDVGLLDAPWNVTVNWGDGDASGPSVLNAQGTIGTLSHTFVGAGARTVTVQVTDKDGGQQSSTFAVTVDAAPTASADAAQVALGGSALIAVLGNDTGAGLVLQSVSAPTIGTAAIEGSAIRYTAPATGDGEAVFSYSVADRNGVVRTAVVTVAVVSLSPRGYLPGVFGPP